MCDTFVANYEKEANEKQRKNRANQQLCEVAPKTQKYLLEQSESNELSCRNRKRQLIE